MAARAAARRRRAIAALAGAALAAACGAGPEAGVSGPALVFFYTEG